MYLKTLLKKAISSTGYYRYLRKTRRASEPLCLIIMYHGLAEPTKSRDAFHKLHDRPDSTHFEAHLKVMMKSARIRSVEDVIEEILNKGQLSCDTICITFDDGYRSVYDYAYPLLRKYDLPATVYLTTDWLNRKMDLWWELLSEMIAESDIAGSHSPEIENLFRLPAGTLIDRQYRTTTEKRNLHSIISSKMILLTQPERLKKISLLAEILGLQARDSSSSAPLTWDQVTEMSGEGILFGSHTKTHINMRHRTMEQIEEEITGSVDEIRRHTNRDVHGFAYPYGQDIEAYDKVTELVSRAGLMYACTAVQGINRSSTNRYLLYRETLPPTPSSALIDREVNLDFISEKEM